MMGLLSMAALPPLSPPTQQSVLQVGPEPGLLDELEPLLEEDSVMARRVDRGALALDQLRLTLPDLLIIEHPLADMPTTELVHAARQLMGNELTILLLSEERRRSELSVLEEAGEIVLRADVPQDELLDAARAFLRQYRRYARSVMVRLRVTIGDTQLLRMAQTVNLSARGMLVRTSEPFPLGSDVRFEMLLPGDEESIRGTARAVRYADPAVERISGVGLRFLELDGDGAVRLSRFLRPAAD